jgi:hypothetical protein
MLLEKIRCCECRAWERDGIDGICWMKAPQSSCLSVGAGFTLVRPRTDANDGCFEGIQIEVAS